MTRVLAVCVAVILSSCVTTTTFNGAAKVPKGADGCRAICDGWGMQLAGMVQLGEYSDGCICEVKRGGPATSSAGAVVPPAAGVVMQMVAQAQEQDAMQVQMQMQQQQMLQQQFYTPPPMQ